MPYFVAILFICTLLIGCQTKHITSDLTGASVISKSTISEKDATGEKPLDKRWTKRIVTQQELLQAGRKDPALTPIACKEILARLNARAPYHISDDIQSNKPIKAPNDFRAYKDWSPLPKFITDFADVPKLMLIVKEHPYIGWYDRGRLQGDTYACIGKPGEDTEVGVYRVAEKDADHVSRSYNNSYGKPAMMPWALRIYDTVWIHAGDVTGAYCSHGCVILPLDPAQEAYAWADLGTVVVVVEALADLPKVAAQLARQSS
ncbi:MAG: L,D-transpeptidase [Desulforhabdus sp.]|jgi:hypothetical protein|nr:L,D-transpeptidase [Desulforhabdus sp.]